MCHLVKMASFSSETNMHARNLAIVWAPNLLRFAYVLYRMCCNCAVVHLNLLLVCVFQMQKWRGELKLWIL